MSRIWILELDRDIIDQVDGGGENSFSGKICLITMFLVLEYSLIMKSLASFNVVKFFVKTILGFGFKDRGKRKRKLNNKWIVIKKVKG